MLDKQQALAAPYTVTIEGQIYKLSLITERVTARYVANLKMQALSDVNLARQHADADTFKELKEAVIGMITNREFDWGGELLNRTLQTPQGVSMLLGILAEEAGNPIPPGLAWKFALAPDMGTIVQQIIVDSFPNPRKEDDDPKAAVGT